jgi:ubiquinone/menaquinone biosynthesis C-methylase UbiE
MSKNLKQIVFEEYQDTHTQSAYIQRSEEGLWESEKYFIDKYFTPKGKVFDLGCGTGRTTIPLFINGYNVTGVDLVPEMINIAKQVAVNKGLGINYQIGDAQNLSFDDKSFDYVLFSNNGWTQIPSDEERLNSLKEIYRILKDDGIFIFTAHPRYFLKRKKFWFKKWVRFYVLKPLGFKIEENSFGDILFTRMVSEENKQYQLTQFTHHSSVNEIKKQIKLSGLKILEANTGPNNPNDKIKPSRKMFYICQK